MSDTSIKFSVAVAIFSTIVLAYPMIKLVLDHCIFEQGCFPYEGSKILPVLTFSLIVGSGLGWFAGLIFEPIRKTKP